MKIRLGGIVIVIISSIILLILISIGYNDYYIMGYEKFHGTINDIKTTEFTCSICIETSMQHHNSNCITYKDTVCYDNTIYAVNKHTTCSIPERMKELSNQKQFMLRTKIGSPVKWYIYDNKCETEVSCVLKLIIAIISIPFIFMKLYGWFMMFDIPRYGVGIKYNFCGMKIELYN